MNGARQSLFAELHYQAAQRCWRSDGSLVSLGRRFTDEVANQVLGGVRVWADEVRLAVDHQRGTAGAAARLPTRLPTWLAGTTQA